LIYKYRKRHDSDNTKHLNRSCRYLNHSLVSKEGRDWLKRMLDLLEPRIEDFVAQKPEYDKNVISVSTLRHPTTKVMLYKSEFVDFLADTIEAVLN